MKNNFTFYKYHGAGNDFILIDNRSLFFPKDDYKFIKQICHRGFGVGSDGIILLESIDNYDFKMIHLNSNGKEGNMCGNGARCAVIFAKKLGIIGNSAFFLAIDGSHSAQILKNYTVRLQMRDVCKVEIYDNYFFLNTGAPHYIEMVSELQTYPVVDQGRKIRYTSNCNDNRGTNVNFVEQINQFNFRVRTYEKDVENETLACGTGATAVALAMYNAKKTNQTNINIHTQGGPLSVCFKPKEKGFEEISLQGPACFIFKGTI